MKSTSEVIFRARDLEAVRAYYSDYLGLSVVLEKESMIGFDTGTFNIYFERGEPNGAVFEFAVDDLTKAKQELMKAGCVIIEEIELCRGSTCATLSA